MRFFFKIGGGLLFWATLYIVEFCECINN